MKAHLIRPLLLGVFAFPLLVAAQEGIGGWQDQAIAGGRGQVIPGTVIAGQVNPGRGAVAAGVPGGTGEGTLYSDPGNNFFSNVPINELSARAYRRFHRLFREIPAGEYWFKYDQGYKVSFALNRHHEYAYFDVNGAFLYSLRYFDGKELSKDLTDFVKRRFPDFKIDVVTEINNGQGIFYTLQITNADHIKTLTIADGRIDVVTDLANGSANIGPAEAAR